MARLKFLSNLLILIAVISCGEVATKTEPPPPTPSATPSEEASDPNHPTGNTAIVLAANFTDPIGTINALPITSPRQASTNLATTHSDALVRSWGHFLYVVNRLGADNIQVIDPTNFATLYQFSTGNGTNPQDIMVVSPTQAYVTLYQPEENQSQEMTVDDLIVFDPTTGAILKPIDLTPFAENDGDRFARASVMVMIENHLFIVLQDLPGNLALPPDQEGKLIRLNTETDQVDGALLLNGRNPFTMTYSPQTGKIYIGCADFFDINSPYGGIEMVDPDAMTSEGMLLDDAVLGGWTGDIEVSGNNGFVVVGLPDYSENRVVRFSLDAATPSLATLYSSPTYLQDIAVDENGLLLVGDRNPSQGGIVFIDPGSGAMVEGPISVGALPSSITFVER